MENKSANFNQKKLLTAIAILIPVAYFLRLNSYHLIFEEPRRALVALEMLLADNWLVPTTNGELYYNKPPLYNWVLIGFMTILGKAEWVIRLPSILSAFVTAVLHYRISRKYIGDQAALFSALFYITSADILFYFSMLGEIDLFYAMIVYLQCVLIFHFYQRKAWSWLFLSSYLLTSAGVLTKGIPSLLFQAVTLLVIFILNKDFKRLFSLWHLAGIGLLLLTSGGYFYIYSLQHDAGPYLGRLFTETFSRTALEKTASDSFKHFLNFPVMLIKISAPWFLLFLLTFKKGWKEKLRNNSFLYFCFWFCIANGIFYLLSPGTRERYLYMFFPFAYSLLAAAICDFPINTIWLKRFYLFIGITVIIGLIGIGIFGITLDTPVPAIICLVIALVLALAIYYLQITDQPAYVLASIACILIARTGFDLVILPTKNQNHPYEIDGQKISQIIQHEPIYLTGPSQPTRDEIKFGGRHFITYQRDEPAYIAFQTSFYLSRYSGRILKYTKDKNLQGFYLSPEDYVNPGKVNVFYRFNNRRDNEDHWYIVYKNKSL